jgi:hypothetical protein
MFATIIGYERSILISSKCDVEIVVLRILTNKLLNNTMKYSAILAIVIFTVDLTEMVVVYIEFFKSHIIKTLRISVRVL